MKKILLMSVLCVGLTSAVYGQDATNNRPSRPQPTVACPEMQKLMGQVRTHRQGCEVCKTNMPQRGMGMGPGGGRGRGQGGRGPGGPPAGAVPMPTPVK